MPSRRTILGPGLLAAALVLSACGSSGGDASTVTTTAAASTTAADSSGGSDTTATTAEAAAGDKVDANTASTDELAAAFTAAGVANADRWAHEVEEYRPYSGTDDWAKLKQELSKYNIDDATLAAILSTLTVS